MKIVKQFQLKIVIFTANKNRCILHGRVFVMGGLRMLQREHFITSLKITWLRRQILQQNCTWNSLSNIDLDDVYTRGDNYASIKSEEVKNPFWNDLLNSWKIFCKSVKIQVLEDILYSPLWYNSNFQHGQHIYFKD